MFSSTVKLVRFKSRECNIGEKLPGLITQILLREINWDVVAFSQISLSQQHQSERMFTMVWISAVVVRADITDKTAKRCAALVEIL